MTDETKVKATPIMLGVGLAAVVAFGLLVFQPASDTDAPAIADTLPVPLSDQVAASAAPDPAVVASQAPEVANDVPELVQGPTFDTFRVEIDGSMVIAGRGMPDQVIDVILGGDAIDRVTADGSGSFVVLPMASPSDQPRRLSLLADPDGAAVPSETSYIVAPIAAPVIVAGIETSVAGDITTAAIAPPDAAPVDVTPVIDTASLAPPTVMQADADGVRIVQGGPAVTTPDIAGNVAFDAITYDPTGEVQLSGRATGDGAVQVYLDNEPLTASAVTQGGDWRIQLPDIDTGIYTLRIDEVDTSGEVVSRLETPFKREEAGEVAAVLAEETSRDGFEVAVKTVQPGATLWAIAEENLGSGIFYIEVFAANADLIRDPDLIYPGQIFRMPDMSQ